MAHYDDKYSLVDGSWLFSSRDLVVHYGGPQDLSAPFLNAWGHSAGEDGAAKDGAAKDTTAEGAAK